ncbi:MAG TPA: phenylalanine--tRNA ligase subunit beta, partial [Acholeplasmataceae bacterium]|nr:phenylalanine--tRNA ligase subunit beta [Acholeplasmataceae bacterium]
ILNRTLRTVRFEEYSKVPSVERDIALVVAKDLPTGEVISEILGLKNTLLSGVTIFDIYTGEKVGPEEKSIAIKLEFSAPQTLSDEVVNQKLNQILKRLKEKFNAVLRG